MIRITVDENVITDLTRSGISIPQQARNAISYDVDIQNSNVTKLSLSNIRDLRGKYVFITDENNVVIAIYDNNKFSYNPNKLKVSDIVNYDCWQVINNPGSVVDKQKQRQQSRQGYTDLINTTTTYNKPPKSSRYVLDKDWNPEVNKQYYIKLLHQHKLGKYAQQLDYTYTIMEDLISHRRKEQTVGKKGVYTNWIKKLASQIETAETLMDALDKNVNPDIPKLLKSLKTLENTTKAAYDFIGYEDDAISTFGYAKQRPSVRIEK